MQKFDMSFLKFVVEPQVRQYCGPIFFTKSLEIASGNVTNNGSFGLVDTGRKKLLVTCFHVWDEFQKEKRENGDLKLCLCLDWGPPVVFDPGAPLGEDEDLDIVTFDMEPLLPACGERRLYPLHQNPPRNLQKPALVFFVGFPGHFRRVEDGALGFGRQAFGVSLSDCNQDGSKFVSNLRSLKMSSNELAGISGSPCFLVRENRPIQLAGFATGVSMNVLSFTHARCLNSDGTISK